jgi:hypothetical protein
MLASHVLDNRAGITSLKFQAAVHFGLFNYDSEIEPWIKSSDPKNSNSLNHILEFVNGQPHGREKILHYCGMDALLTYRLWKIQEQQVQNLDNKKLDVPF